MPNKIPPDWKIVRLGDVAEVRKGTSFTSKSLLPGNVPVIAGGKQPAYYHKYSNRESETITVSASGAYAGYVSFHNDPIFATDCTTIRSSSNITTTRYLYHYLQWKQELIYSRRNGSAQPHIYPKDLTGLDIFLPPLKGQLFIANILDNYERVLDQIIGVIKQKKQLHNTLLNEIFSKSGHQTKAAVVCLGDIMTLEYGQSLPKYNRTQGDYPVIGSGGIIDYCDTGYVDNPGLVIGRKGSIGTVTWVKSKSFPIDTTYYVKCDSKTISLRWLYYLLFRKNLANLNRATGVPGLNRDDVYSLKVRCPDLDIQNRIVLLLDSSSRNLEYEGYYYKKILNLKTSIAHELLNGRLYDAAQNTALEE